MLTGDQRWVCLRSSLRVNYSMTQQSARGRGVLLFAGLSGLLLAVSFYGKLPSLIAWIALVPLLVAIRGRGVVVSATLSFLCGLCFYPGWSPWVLAPAGVRWTDALLVWSYCSLYFALFGALFSLLARHRRVPALLAAPAAWVTAEFLRANAFDLAMPLSQIGHSQYLNLTLIQVASITGVYGLSFLIVMVNALLAEIAVRRSLPLRESAVVLGLLAAVLLFGAWRLSEPASGGEGLPVSVVQPNIAQHEKWDRALRDQHMEKNIRLSKAAAETMPGSLIVWPESAITGFVQKELGLYRAISRLARQTHAFLLVGGAGRPKFGSKAFRETTAYNSVFLVNPQGQIQQRYDKIRLMPFGEFVPYRNLIPWPDYYLQSRDGYAPGAEYTLFDAAGLRFAALICWEMYFPELAREFTRRGAEILVNMTNEAWFGDSDASRQFFALSVFRAVENAVYVVRAANTGISGFIDPYGRILSTVEQGGKSVEVAGYAVADVQRRAETTVYTRLGEVFALVNLALCGSLICVTALRRRSSLTPVRSAA